VSKLKVDLTDVEGSDGFELLPDGDYDVEIDSFEMRQGPKGDYISWVFKVISGEFKGRLLWRITSLTQKALPFLRQLCDAAGVPFDKKGVDPEDAVGSRLQVRVITESDPEFDDKNVIKRFLPLGGKKKSAGKKTYGKGGAKKKPAGKGKKKM